MKKLMETIASMKIAKIAVGVLLGALGGFLYYRFIGCSSGSCPITSNPFLSITYGAIMGLLVSI